MRKSDYDKLPFVAVTDALHPCLAGWDKIAAELQRAIGRGRLEKPILVVDCYPGVDELAVLHELTSRLTPKLVIHAAEAYHSPEKIDTLVTPFLESDDLVFGRFSSLSLVNFFDAEPLWRFRRIIDELKEGLVLIIGCGASLIAWGHLLVYADLARWTAQQRLLRNQIGNLGVDNRTTAADLRYKRAFFVDWRVADRWKQPLIRRWDYVLDTHNPAEPKLAEANDIRSGLREAVTRPFRLVPAFHATPRAGQWLQEVFGLDQNGENIGLCFDCVPEENALRLGLGDMRFEIPAKNLMFYQAGKLLGQKVHLRFRDEFPIRFKVFDTMTGENNSMQVHPLADYVQRNIGIRSTQDKSYYLLDADAGASVYLGLRPSVSRTAVQRDLEIAQTGEAQLLMGKYTNQFIGKKHDHFLIPAGIVHGSAASSMVLEIAATPCLFTFQISNLGRAGQNGKPHPLYLEHSLANVKWEADTNWTKLNLVNRIETVAKGDGWREERTGLHEGSFIETRRHRFTKKVGHDTNGVVNVINLVGGEEAVVESPTEAFAPFVVHYAETFIVPAAVGEYTIRPHGPAVGKECATLKAFVRASAWA